MARKTGPETPLDTLGVLSEKVQSLSERLALGSLDTVVLLFANLVTFLTGALATWLPSLLEKATHVSALWFSGAGWADMIYLGAGVVVYAIAYLRDDIRQRLAGLLFLLAAVAWVSLQAYVLFAATFIVNPSLECGLPGGGFPLFFLVTLLFIRGLFVLGSSIARRLVNGFEGWLRKNTPLRWRIERDNYRSSQGFMRIGLAASPRNLWAASLGLVGVLALTSSLLICGFFSGTFDSNEYPVLIIFILVLLPFVAKSLSLAFKRH